jgi:hypothetical protein
MKFVAGIVTFLISIQSDFHAQISQKIGSQIGLTLNFGTHINNIGFTANLFYHDYFTK